jgi:hypothetical protein
LSKKRLAEEGSRGIMIDDLDKHVSFIPWCLENPVSTMDSSPGLGWLLDLQFMKGTHTERFERPIPD